MEFRTSSDRTEVVNIDVVIPVHNALGAVQDCLRALSCNRDGYRVRCIVIDDASEPATTDWLRTFCAAEAGFELIEQRENEGYTRRVNHGLRVSNAPCVILLNSDAVVTRGWLEGLWRCMTFSPDIGIVGPLSNAAGWQSVPRVFDDAGAFAINALPPEVSPEEMASLVASASTRSYPRMPAINGFCFMVSRPVIAAIGLMDEARFPIGYGEETDYCIRAVDAGFTCAVADDVYVFHAKSQSFDHERRAELSARGDRAPREKHTSARLDALLRQSAQGNGLAAVRARIQSKFHDDRDLRIGGEKPRSILFVLPVGAGGGGAHSVVQEALGLVQLGVRVRIAVIQANLPDLRAVYRDTPGAQDLSVGYLRENHLVVPAWRYDLVIATLHSSVSLLSKAATVYPGLLPAYYIQDYEPRFFPVGSPDWKTAQDSYALIPGALLFAKTWWLVDTVAQCHGLTVRKVLPSIDHEVYGPGPGHKGGKLRLVAMIRPDSPRRGAARTLRVLKAALSAHPHRLRVHVFGCSDGELMSQGLERDFPFHNHGVLTRHQVGRLLGRCDVFLDLSDYQAFGCTALEAMACGCAVLVPLDGGAREYAIDDVNCLVVDTRDETSCARRLVDLLGNLQRLSVLRAKAVATASRFSIKTAAASELALFADALDGKGVSPGRVLGNLVRMLWFRLGRFLALRYRIFHVLRSIRIVHCLASEYVTATKEKGFWKANALTRMYLARVLGKARGNRGDYGGQEVTERERSWRFVQGSRLKWSRYAWRAFSGAPRCASRRGRCCLARSGLSGARCTFAENRHPRP